MAEPLLRTFSGRAIIVGVAIKLVVSLLRLASGGVPALLDAVDSIAGIAIATGAAYFFIQLFLLAKRRLLWRVRRKLILSYIFIGVVPAILIAAFFLLGALLLFFNFSSYLVQTEIVSLSDRVRFLSASTALELQRGGGRDMRSIVTRAEERAMPELPGLSIAVIPVDRACSTPGVATSAPGRASGSAPASARAVPLATAGPWAHVRPPATIPAWLSCDGFAGVLAYARAEGADQTTDMIVRGVAFPESAEPAYAIVVDVPVGAELKQRLRRTTGVDVRGIRPVEAAGPLDQPIPGGVDASRTGSSEASGPLSWVTFLNYRDWTTGTAGTLLVSTQLNIQEIYARLAAAQGVVGDRPFGQALLLVLLVVVGGLFFVIEVVALVVGSALARSITGSVHELFTGTERVRQGDFSHKIAITAKDQLGELAGSFNEMTASIEDLLRQANEKKRLEEELRIAHEIQMSLLPQGPLLMPGLSATALCIPAREVGGDYYDFLPLDSHRVGILIADVSGKGTSAALYMAQLKGLMLSLSKIHSSPRALLVDANRIIAQHLDSRSFITITYAVVDLRARTMTYARAGHTPLIHVACGAPTITAENAASGIFPGSSANSAVEGPRHAQILTPDGMVLGLNLDDGQMFNSLLEEATIPIHAGDLYVFFTDGISEAMNAVNDCFGEVRLAQLVEDQAGLPPEELRERILREIETFVNGAPQHDDMTMILLKVEEMPQSVVTAEAAALAGLK
jgi:sigma-B regulation protein RsbU (phosphoserine phosphatase)